MRKSTLTQEEVLAAEKAADNRRRSRKQGFDKMYERDQHWKRLSNGVVMLWYVHPDQRPLGIAYENIPEDSFALVIDGKKYVFNLEEFRKWLRWG